MDQPGIQICLQSFQTFIILFSEGDPKEFIQHCAIEPLNKSVDSGCAYFGTAIFSIVQLQERFKGMIWCVKKSSLLSVIRTIRYFAK